MTSFIKTEKDIRVSYLMEMKLLQEMALTVKENFTISSLHGVSMRKVN